MKILTKDKVAPQLSYKESGSGEPLIFLHGLFGSLSNWGETIKHFNQNYRVIIPDLPIYNGYAKGEGMDGIVDYIDSLVEHLHLDNFTLIGNSMGGHVAILYALKFPSKVNRLVLVASSGLFENTMGASYPKRSDYLFIEERVRYTFYKEQSVSKSLVDEIYTTVNDIRKSLRIIKMVRSVNRNNVSEELSKLDLPVLLIWGRQDRITPIEVAFEFKRLLRDKVVLEIVEDCGHVPMMEQPAIFNSLLENFIAQTSLVKQAI